MIHSSLPMVVFLITFGIFYVVIAFKLKTLPGKTKKDFLNEFLYACMWLLAAIMFPFSYSTSIDPAVYDAFNYFSEIAMIGIFLVIIIIIGRQKILVSKRPDLKEAKQFEKFEAAFNTDSYSLRKDILRKSYHAFIPVFVILAYVIGGLLKTWFSLDFVSSHDLGIFIIVNCGFGGLFLFAAADIFRLSCFFEKEGLSIFHLVPLSILNILTKRMHKSELYTFVPTVLILLSFVPFLPFDFAVFTSVTLIASISDAMASIAGKAYNQFKPGRLIFPKDTYRFFKSKNVVGYIAGAVSTFSIVLLMLFIFPIDSISAGEMVLTSFFVSLTFFMIDFFSPPINDNLLNSLLCGYVMVILVHIL
ncbi:MAG: hypothetical protein ACTSUE_02650 [Promethearchaeota archaeon]